LRRRLLVLAKLALVTVLLVVSLLAQGMDSIPEYFLSRAMICILIVALSILTKGGFSFLPRPMLEQSTKIQAFSPRDDELFSKIDKKYRTRIDDDEASKISFGEIRRALQVDSSGYVSLVNFDLIKYLETEEIDPILIRLHGCPLKAIDTTY